MNRYYAYNYLISGILLVDTIQNEIIYYLTNTYGQIYNLIEGGRIFKITKQKRNGLIRRLKSDKYSVADGYPLDSYVYLHLLSDEEKAGCKDIFKLAEHEKLIAEGDDFCEIVEKISEWAYENYYSYLDDMKCERKNEYTLYYKNYLSALKKVVNQ